jgi:exopolysaccharide biosynthesis WecB/TagA/CpsF family protein
MNTHSRPDRTDITRIDAALHARPLRKVQVLNAFVHDVTMDQVLDLREGLILTLHVDMIMKLQKDREFHAILDNFDIVTCDSQILFFAMRFLGTPVRERVSGSDYFPLFYERYRDDLSVRVFLMGGKPGIAEIAARKINAKVGRDLVVGTSAPPFDFDRDPAEIERMIEAVNASGATVLLLGLGGGRQEKFIIRYRDQFPTVRLFLPLGGTIDYEAGTFRRPPAWVTNAGLEWLFRLVKEPRQRWHRYVVHEPPVIPLLIRQKLGCYRDPFGKA